jgi:hypothetical protein
MMAGRNEKKNWDLDLCYGAAGENLVAKALGMTGEKVEVKRDERAWKTGSVFIELNCNGKPSGINTTEADSWCIIFRPGRFVRISTDELKKLVERCIRIDRTTAGGDFNQTTGALVPLDWIIYGNWE